MVIVKLDNAQIMKQNNHVLMFMMLINQILCKVVNGWMDNVKII